MRNTAQLVLTPIVEGLNNMQELPIRKLRFINRSKKDLLSLPRAVQSAIGYDLKLVQFGQTPNNAKKFKGLSGVMELVENYDSDTYRAIYVVNIGDKVCVLHCFKKKSKSGIATPPKDVNLIKQRYKEALEINKMEVNK